MCVIKGNGSSQKKIYFKFIDLREFYFISEQKK